MYRATSLATLIVLQCSVCLTIKVPVAWNNGASEVQDQPLQKQQQLSEEEIKPQSNQQKLVPTEYFEYTAKKPQFAVDIAQFHGVPNPKSHYRAQPVRPYTGREKPSLGIHHMYDVDKPIFQQYQTFVNKNEPLKQHVTPISSNYEVFHPYTAEEPALQNIYKDPVLSKIRNDIHDSKNRLQNYEKVAGESDIKKDEYLENPEVTESKHFPHKNTLAPYEVHQPLRRPAYYKPLPRFNNRDKVLNQRFKHPWNQNYIKIRPVHYRPLKNHINHLRQHHAVKYDDEQNEYPQLSPIENSPDPQDGYDIYEKGRNKYIQLRNNVDESINKAVLENRPVIQQKLELQNDQPEADDDDESEFIPVKNYAQVRKTETVKHLPREAAYEDAETLDEILNAPRLREAVKSEKAQTVYTEEGYEDSAYDHAGEQKHASDHEGHGGYLKQKEISGGKYKIPSLNAGYQDAKGTAYQDKVLHGKKWENENKDDVVEEEQEDYSESESEHNDEGHSYQEELENNRNKREDQLTNSTENNYSIDTTDNDKINENAEHDIDKRETNFEVPTIDLASTLLTEEEILDISKQKRESKKNDVMVKYPYYFNKLNSVNQHSPLRYAENVKFIPKKSSGGTEFYDSRAMLECPEVDDVDPLPEKLKNDNNSTSKDDNSKESSSGEDSFDTVKEQPRLGGLGDKIDCFKVKYFGENPLDSPFFKEEIISNPEPVTLPSLPIYKLKTIKHSENKPGIPTTDNKKRGDDNIYKLLNKLRNYQINIDESVAKNNNSQIPTQFLPLNTATKNQYLNEQSNVYSDIMENIKKYHPTVKMTDKNKKIAEGLLDSKQILIAPNITYNFFQNKDDVTKSPPTLRKKRSSPFVYEPYKIIRDGQVQDSKKTTTTSNISPLIKQLQLSRVVDKVSKMNQEHDPSYKNVKRNVNLRTYKDIGRKDREKGSETITEEPGFVDVSTDQRRGEPRYELRPANHKPQYTPVENRKSMSINDYKTQSNNHKNSSSTSTENKEPIAQVNQKRKPNIIPSTVTFDVSQYIPTATEAHTVAASNAVKIVAEATPIKYSKPIPENTEGDEEYTEYDDEEDEELPNTTTTTTHKPSFRRRVRSTTTTTEKPEEEIVPEREKSKLHLVTRFRDYSLSPPEKTSPKPRTERPRTTKSYPANHEEAPKYREKKKKSSSSTLVTDTKKYGDGVDDMKKDQIDALIGVKEDMDDYIPMYEKDEKRRELNQDQYRSSELNSDNTGGDDEDDNDEDEDEDDNDDDSDEDDDEDDEDDTEKDDGEEEEVLQRQVTTPEPTKRTLMQTTEAPTPTTENRISFDAKPVVSKKKIEIHKQIPVNNSSPNVTQFRQDIKEIEIIKEIPATKKKPHQNVEAFELYKDEKLAKDVNKLSDVEVFKENLDLVTGPKHGGNYRRATKEELKEISESLSSTAVPIQTEASDAKVPKDTEASQSNNKKQIELIQYDSKRSQRGNVKSFADLQRAGFRGKNAKLIELKDLSAPRSEGMHGGNLKPFKDIPRRRGRNRSEKLIEFRDEHNNDDDDSSSHSHSSGRGASSYDTRNERPLHGGNYRSAKLIKPDDEEAKKDDDIKVKSATSSSGDARRNAALLLNSFAQAVPILTTTPAYILDPSKRMYYYVDA